MILKTITYSYLANLGNYSNERVDATAQLEDGDDRDVCLQRLKDWVHSQTNSKAEYDKMFKRRISLAEALYETEGKLTKAREQWEQVAAFLRAQGIKPDAPDFPMLAQPALPAAEAEIEFEEDEDEEDEDELYL